MLAAWPAQGAEVTRVVSAMDGSNRFDFNLTATWIHEVKSASVKRELQSNLAPRNIEVIKDLLFSQTRDILSLRADVGILWDVGLHIEMPLVLSDASNLDFDQSEGSNCHFPSNDPNAPRPSCVNEENATILRDRILPVTADPMTGGIASWGQDAEHNRMFTPGSTNVFRGPVRKGFEYLGVGLTWAPFNQARDDTKPTWTLSVDAKLDVFKDKRFDPSNPTGNTAVGQGYHQFVGSTFVSKRFRWFDPYFGAWYTLPVRTNGSPFQQYGPTQTSVNPQQRAGAVMGVEQIAWENPRGDQRVTVEARAYVDEHFFGRERSEIWEPLSGSSACASNNTAACRPDIDLHYLDPNMVAVDAPHPGITEIESYATIGGDVGLNVQVGKFIRFRGLFGFRSDMPHMITAASSGVDLNHNNRVEPVPENSGDPVEANPTYRPAIDQPGRRFRVEGSKIWTLFIQGSMMF